MALHKYCIGTSVLFVGGGGVGGSSIWKRRDRSGSGSNSLENWFLLYTYLLFYVLVLLFPLMPLYESEVFSDYLKKYVCVPTCVKEIIPVKNAWSYVCT